MGRFAFKLLDGGSIWEMSVEPNKEKSMATTYSYACKDFPGMEACPAHFHAETYDELWNIIELHASVAHGENPAAWPAEDIAQIKALIKSE